MTHTPAIAYVDRCSNLIGSVSAQPQVRGFLEAVVRDPNPRTWNKAYSLIIRGDRSMLTLWQAVCIVDPRFPTQAPATNNLARKWPKVPDQLTLYRALKVATSTPDYEQPSLF